MRIWLMAARPRTLPASIAPVLVGSAAAWYAIDAARFVSSGTVTGAPAWASLYAGAEFSWPAFVAALIGAIFIQIGTNLANDYSDAKRGADNAERLGPVRVTAAGLVAPRRVLAATWVAFAIAVAAGLYLVAVTGPEILLVGVVSIAAGVLYTGGPRPYGYAGMGELFVFVFFGLVAVNGSYYVQLERLDWLPFLLSILVGLLSTAVLVVNNLRDIETDRRAGKLTLAVRLGRERTRAFFVALVAGALVLLPLALVLGDGPGAGVLAWLSAPLALKPTRAVLTRTDGPSLNAALAGTGTLLAAFSVLLSVGLLMG